MSFLKKFRKIVCVDKILVQPYRGDFPFDNMFDKTQIEVST